MYGCVGKPICCPPQYCVRDTFTPRIIPVIQPVVTVNRQNIVDVPQPYVQQVTQNVTVDRGFANTGNFGFGNAGFGGAGFGGLGNAGAFGASNRLFTR